MIKYVVCSYRFDVDIVLEDINTLLSFIYAKKLSPLQKGKMLI